MSGVVVVGTGPLALAVIGRIEAAGATVTAILTATAAMAHTADLEAAGARVVTGTPASPATLRAAGIADAQALVLAGADDTGNVDVALAARALRADLCLVVRLFDPTLARYLGETLAPITPLSGRGHAVVVGAGNVGVRVVGALAAWGHRVVVVEQDAEGRHLDGLRAAGHHVIVGDALLEQTLRLAGTRSASVVLGLTDSDAVNLHVALTLAGPGGLPVVLRLQSPELSAHVRARGGALAASPAEIASEVFARAALGSS